MLKSESWWTRKLKGLPHRVRRWRRRVAHRPKFELAVYAVMQNEAHILREWVDHHLAEGFEHIFLVDHGSTDNWRDVLVADIASKRVSVHELGRVKGDINVLRARNAERALDASKWLLVQDLDEFTFAQGARSLKQILRSLPTNVCQVAVPWVVFGSNGNIEQPSSVVQSCLRSEDMALRATLCDQRWAWPAKAIVRCKTLRRFRVHLHDVAGETVVPLPSGHVPVVSEFHVPNALAARHDEIEILQHHYINQSRSFYAQKMQRLNYWLQTRGLESKYSWQNFEVEEARLNAVVNNKLAKIQQSRGLAERRH